MLYKNYKGNSYSQIAELEATIASGNRELLPVFNRNTDSASSDATGTKDVSDSG